MLTAIQTTVMLEDLSACGPKEQVPEQVFVPALDSQYKHVLGRWSLVKECLDFHVVQESLDWWLLLLIVFSSASFLVLASPSVFPLGCLSDATLLFHGTFCVFLHFHGLMLLFLRQSFYSLDLCADHFVPSLHFSAVNWHSLPPCPLVLTLWILTFVSLILSLFLSHL